MSIESVINSIKMILQILIVYHIMLVQTIFVYMDLKVDITHVHSNEAFMSHEKKTITEIVLQYTNSKLTRAMCFALIGTIGYHYCNVLNQLTTYQTVVYNQYKKYIGVLLIVWLMETVPQALGSFWSFLHIAYNCLDSKDEHVVNTTALVFFEFIVSLCLLIYFTIVWLKGIKQMYVINKTVRTWMQNEKRVREMQLLRAIAEVEGDNELYEDVNE